MPRCLRNFICGALGAALLSLPVADACTRILSNDHEFGVVVARTMDWPETTEPIITVFPAGMRRNGGYVGPDRVVRDNPAQWTSRYGSVVTTVYGIGTADGVNERGLGAHMLFLQATDFGPRDRRKPGLHAGLWAQYVLDNAATVEEALALLERVQIVSVTARGHTATVHLGIEDASGDSAIIEYIDGRRLVHHSREYRIMTNDPSYTEQLALLRRLDFSSPSSDMPLPGNVAATDRFQRAAYFLGLLPEPRDEREAIAGVLAIARNASLPFGAPFRDFNVFATEYRTAINLTNRRYFFEFTTAPNVIWVNLDQLNLAPGAPVLTLDPNNIALSGDVTRSFQTAPRAPF